MAYDLHTPYGIVPGQVSPYEQLQSDTVARHRAAAMAGDAQSAQLQMLKRSMAGGDGGLENDPFFSEAGPFGTKPKETGAVDLRARNEAVDARQQQTAGMRDMIDLGKPRDYLTATERGDMARSKHASGMADLKSDEMLRGLTDPMIQDLIKGLGSTGRSSPGAPPAGMNPNVTPGGPNLNAMGGGSVGGGLGSDDLNTKLRTLAALQSMRSGKGSIPDFAAQDEERDYRKQQHDLSMQTGRMTLAEKQREIQEAADARRLGRPANQRIDDFVMQNEGVAQPLVAAVSGFAKKDTAMIGTDPSPRAMQAVIMERDNFVKALSDRGYTPDQALQQANLLIQRAVAPYVSDMNAGQIQKLLLALGTSAPDQEQPQAPGGYSPFAGVGKSISPAIGKAFPSGAFGPAR